MVTELEDGRSRSRHNRPRSRGEEEVRSGRQGIHRAQAGRGRQGEDHGVRHEEASGIYHRESSNHHDGEVSADGSRHDEGYTHEEEARRVVHSNHRPQEGSHHGVAVNENDHSVQSEGHLPEAVVEVRMDPF